jgi:hypothetical protein
VFDEMLEGFPPVRQLLNPAGSLVIPRYPVWCHAERFHHVVDQSVVRDARDLQDLVGHIV